MTRVGAPSCFRAYSTSVFSRLEGLVWRIAPNAGNLSRSWRVVAGLALQTCATFPAFVVGLAGFGNICRVILRRLLSFLYWLTTFAVFFSGVCCRFGRNFPLPSFTFIA